MAILMKMMKSFDVSSVMVSVIIIIENKKKIKINFDCLLTLFSDDVGDEEGVFTRFNSLFSDDGGEGEGAFIRLNF